MFTHNIEEAVLMADRVVVMGKDPGHVVTEMRVTLRHPRRRKDTAFQAIVDKVYAAVTGKAEVEAVPGRARPLPKARLNALAGLTEKVLAESGRHDLPRLSAELQTELDDLLPIVEAGEMVGFVTVQEGDILLTPLGQAYAEASILTRKEMIAARILRLPVISWMYETLQQDDNQRVAEDFFLDKLRNDFGEWARAQFDIAVAWGRFAELYSFDAAAGELYLEG
jgi:NitT/TauT family transport system ATP-binding protein